MDKKEGSKTLRRSRLIMQGQYTLTTAIVLSLFWFIWYLIKGEVPAISELRVTESLVITLPFTISRWFDVLGGAACSFLFITALIADKKMWQAYLGSPLLHPRPIVRLPEIAGLVPRILLIALIAGTLWNLLDLTKLSTQSPTSFWLISMILGGLIFSLPLTITLREEGDYSIGEAIGMGTLTFVVTGIITGIIIGVMLVAALTSNPPPSSPLPFELIFGIAIIIPSLIPVIVRLGGDGYDHGDWWPDILFPPLLFTIIAGLPFFLACRVGIVPAYAISIVPAAALSYYLLKIDQPSQISSARPLDIRLTTEQYSRPSRLI